MQVVIRDSRLAITRAQPLTFDLRIDMAIRNKNPGPATVVEIVKLHSPTQPGSNSPQPGRIRNIVKIIVALIEIQGQRIVTEVSFDNVLTSTMGEIVGRDPHASLFRTIFVVGHTGAPTNFSKCPIMVVVIKQAGRGITSDINIRPAITIEVSGQRGESVAGGSLGHSRFCRDIRKCPISFIAIQSIHSCLEPAWAAENTDPFPLAPSSFARMRHGVVAEIHVADEENIHLAVAVIIQEAASRAPLIAGCFQSGFFSYVTECSIAIIVIKNILSPIGYEQIEVAVIVIIAHTTTLAPSGLHQTGVLGNIRKCAVAIVVIQVPGGSFPFREPLDS